MPPGFAWLRRSVSWTTIIVALVVVGLAVAVFVAAGGVNVSADTPDGWLARNGLHFVFKRNIAARARGVIPPADLSSPSRVRLAAQHFDMVCSNCHGRPGFGQSVVALSMSPRPQYLPKVVDQFTDSELYMIVQHGVKYSAMPSWPTGSREDEVWSLVAFLRQLPKMDAATYRQMTALPQNVNTPPGASGGDTALRPATAEQNSPPVDEFLYAAPSAGFSDQSVHDNPVATCTRCHGADGSGAVTGGEAPNLTIEDPAYIRAALQAYTSGARKSGFMENIAVQLSSAQIAALSDYYAGLPIKTVSSPQADPALVERGRTIATEGIRERAVPACAMCHESQGAGVVGAPHIAGQSATYLRRELAAMRHGGRGSTVRWNPMPAEAHDLDDKDIAALAAYYSGLQPAKAAAAGSAATSPAMVPASHIKLDLVAAKTIFDSRCVKCHANEGRGDRAGGYPDLTLQSAPYVAQSLYAFRTRARPNGKMFETASSLTFDEMTSLAHYIGGLTPQPALLRPDTQPAPRGAAIAMQGIPSRGVPACLSCHDAKGATALPLIPRLQGQSVLYLRYRLDNFAKRYDVNVSALDPMPAIASQLTKDERADLAAYFSAASPIEKPSARP
jgi:cytochrome c553